LLALYPAAPPCEGSAGIAAWNDYMPSIATVRNKFGGLPEFMTHMVDWPNRWPEGYRTSASPKQQMSILSTSSLSIRSPGRGLLSLCAGAGAYLNLFSIGDILLRDSDTYWQIKVGRWIIEHGSMPQTDVYSSTHFGQPWISSSWLSQVLFAVAFERLDWAGPVMLSSLAIGATVAIFVHLLSPHFGPMRSILIATVAALMSGTHFLARPHVLALPVMIAFVGGLMLAADRRSQPPWLLLPLMSLWANLHGGFVLGLALIGPIGLEAVWCSDSGRRIALAARWAVFGIATLVASCCTPYGWSTLLAAEKILSLGKLLSMIWEWMPADFSSFSFFEAALLGLIGLAFYRGLTLSLPRTMLLLGLIWMALTHVRNIEVFAFLAPLVMAQPAVGRFGTTKQVDAREDSELPSPSTLLAALAILVAGSISTKTLMAHHQFSFLPAQTPVAAVDVLDQRRAERIFSTAPFGGYLIFRDMKAFIDGRAELYGEQFVMDYFDAVEGRNLETLLRFLQDYRIDATLLNATSPAAKMLDHMAGWTRLYTDEIAVVHVRENAQPSKSAQGSLTTN
jgi:hypothetical protein